MKLGSLVTLVVALSAVAAPATGATSARGLPDCLGKPRVRPASITVYCADAGELVHGIRWSAWGGASARGAGVATYNDCTPNCAAGHEHSFRARLTVSGRQRCATGSLAYTTLVVRSVTAKPKPLTMTFRCR